MHLKICTIGNTKHAYTYQALDLVYGKQGRLEEAHMILLKALSISEAMDAYAIYYNLVLVCFCQRKQAESESCYA